MLGLDLGIDMGTAQTIIAVPGRGVMLKEPSVIAVDKADGTYHSLRNRGI